MSVTERLAARLPVLGDRIDKRPVVAVVRLHGVISASLSPVSRGSINLEHLEVPLRRAFGHESLAAVALLINSPGGAPTQSALVGERIRALAAKREVPVLAFCEDVAASGGYWLACAADEIFAHPTSQVGSIGVISASFGVTGLMERLGVERRVYTAGTKKSRLDPFSPEKPEDVAWLRGLQGELHEMFVAWVRERRGDKLAADTDLVSGEVWTGARAKELGLVDELGSLRGVLAQRYPDAHVIATEPRRSLLARLGVGARSTGAMSAGMGDRVTGAIEALEQRAAWSRFGL
jgi:signal peptide peptidase SppA